MTIYPSEHITDSQILSPDAEIDLYELTPIGEVGVFRFKNDNTQSWLGNEYLGLPLEFSGESSNSEGSMPQPQLIIGETDIDLSIFKALVFDGSIDGASITKHTVLLQNLLNNVNVKVTRSYRVKRVNDYSSMRISLSLASFSPSGPSTLPFRQFIPPAFPFVRL